MALRTRALTSYLQLSTKSKDNWKPYFMAVHLLQLRRRDRVDRFSRIRWAILWADIVVLVVLWRKVPPSAALNGFASKVEFSWIRLCQLL